MQEHCDSSGSPTTPALVLPSFFFLSLTPLTNFTQVLNLRPLIFSLPPFGWLRSVTVIPYF